MESELIEIETDVAEDETESESDDDLIAQRAYEIHVSEGGTEIENWLRAERELLEERLAHESD